jgi:hypothetical protein
MDVNGREHRSHWRACPCKTCTERRRLKALAEMDCGLEEIELPAEDFDSFLSEKGW